MNKAIIKRWNEKVVPNGWDKMGAEGAQLYLEKYGHNIGPEKVQAFADYAYSLGFKEFGDEMKKHSNILMGKL